MSKLNLYHVNIFLMIMSIKSSGPKYSRLKELEKTFDRLLKAKTIAGSDEIVWELVVNFSHDQIFSTISGVSCKDRTILKCFAITAARHDYTIDSKNLKNCMNVIIKSDEKYIDHLIDMAVKKECYYETLESLAYTAINEGIEFLLFKKIANAQTNPSIILHHTLSTYLRYSRIKYVAYLVNISPVCSGKCGYKNCLAMLQFMDRGYIQQLIRAGANKDKFI